MVEIYCPRCAWHPERHSRWSCARASGGCGHVWNTFDTAGICPECHWHWLITQCLSCHRYSPHQSWYHDPKPPGEPTQADEETRKTAAAPV